jgi:hypothetical protein
MCYTYGGEPAQGFRAMRRRGLAGFLLASVTTASAALAMTSPTAAATVPTVTVTPISGLGSQVVQVSWANFPPTTNAGLYQVSILQCPYPVTLGTPIDFGTAGCYNVPPSGSPDHQIGTWLSGLQTAPNGSGSAFFEVRAGQDLPSLNCSEAQPCSIVVRAGGLGQKHPDVIVTTKVTFAPSFTDCPKVDTPDVRTAGEASAERVMEAWAARRCTGQDPLAIDYSEQSSELGRSEFQADQVDMGITSLPFTAAELGSAPKRAYAYAPLDATSVVVAFSIPNAISGAAPIQSINLTPRLLARLITDSDPSGGYGLATNIFQDPEFLQLNPVGQGRAYPEFNSKGVLVRADRNADTTLVTGWIASNPGAQQFLTGTDTYCVNNNICVNPAWKNPQYPTDVFQKMTETSQLVPITEVGLVPEYSFYRLTQWGDASDKPPNPISAQGVFSIMDLASARAYHLGIANLCSSDDLSTCVGPDGPATASPVAGSNAGLIAGYAAMKTNADGITQVPNYSAPSPAYPLVKYDYAVVPTHDLSPTGVQKAKDFLDYVADPNGGQSPSVLPAGYVPLSSNIAAETRAVADAIQPAGTGTGNSPPSTLGSGAEPGSAGSDGGLSGGLSASDLSPGSTAPATVGEALAAGLAAAGLGKSAKPQVALSTHRATSSRRARGGFFGGIADNPGRLVLPLVLAIGLAALAAGSILRWRAKAGSRGAGKGKEAVPSTPT